LISEVKNKLEKLNTRVRDWMLEHADSPHAQIWLSVISFFEASILPLPPSTLMIAMVVLGKRKRWAYLALLTTITSVAGGLFGYLVGFALYDTLGAWIVEQYGLAGRLESVGTLFTNNAFWSIFFVAFTPIPYKVFTISAGFFSINILIFIIASLLGRGLRFFVLSYLAYLFGEHVAQRIFRYFALVIITAVAVAILLVVWQAL
jgi:membrane protein YqaA with SNARE-associated domain